MPGRLPATGLDGVQRGRDVVVGQLALQRQGRGGDHDPLVRLLGQTDQGRRQVAEGLAGAGAGLHQQMLARSPTRRAIASAISTWPGRSLTADAAGPRAPAPRGGRPRVDSPRLVGHRSTLTATADAQRTRGQLVRGELAGQVRVAPGRSARVPSSVCSLVSNSPDWWIRLIRSPRSYGTSARTSTSGRGSRDSIAARSSSMPGPGPGRDDDRVRVARSAGRPAPPRTPGRPC